MFVFCKTLTDRYLLSIHLNPLCIALTGVQRLIVLGPNQKLLSLDMGGVRRAGKDNDK